MTTTENRTATHPLSRMTAEEVDTARQVVTDAGLVQPSTVFVYVGLDEPHKRDVQEFTPGTPVERRLRVLLLDRATGAGRDVLVSVSQGAVLRDTEIDGVADGQVPITDAEFEAIEPILAVDEGWQAAMAKRGLAVADVRAVPLSAGSYFDDEFGHRVVRVLGFHQADPDDLPWAHPVDGVVAYVDITRGVTTAVHDHFDLPVPAERVSLEGTPRDLKPIEITQPEGRSFTVDDDVVRWAGWEFRVGFDAREGLTLNQLSVDGRSVVHRASIAEMVVPYADPSPVRFWQNYFDTGEYLFARYTNSLELGCDCLGEIHYLDATIADETGHPRVMRNAVCLHEEDYGVGWKHTDMFTGMAETRRSRRLVISFFTTIGNYDYGFYWYLYTDGTIQLESKATGGWCSLGLPRRGAPLRHRDRPRPGCAVPPAPVLRPAGHGRRRRRRLGQHGARGGRRPGAGQRRQPYGNAFTRSLTPITRESEGGRTTDATKGRTWHVVNPGKTNRLGQPVGYALHPENAPCCWPTTRARSTSGRRSRPGRCG